MSEIVKNRLWLGNMADAKSAGESNPLRVTHVLNVADTMGLSLGNLPNGVLSDMVGLSDFGDDDIFSDGTAPEGWGESAEYANFTRGKAITKYRQAGRCFDFLDTAMEKPESRVLVHCAMGVNRSATIVIAYLMKSKRWTLGRSFHHVKKIRMIVSPANGYVKQLSNYERVLQQSGVKLSGQRSCGCVIT
eukprot:gnl/MRDRNA2_/MRDRNA2_93897_c0_seq1.p1 gnl/MRDRNA2_/MRDRNA2_93897_c0~~gnl/MRDRNA2_/MRDRNA2_93897_c0_seq1.p1  ORF type:complete len:190 (+),score=16.80 gnl/MRDRNA2_/MRDRNA2_93897_c0_seq1:212-781(+)